MGIRFPGIGSDVDMLHTHSVRRDDPEGVGPFDILTVDRGVDRAGRPGVVNVHRYHGRSGQARRVLCLDG